MTAAPKRPCPICGARQQTSNLFAHVGSERCLAQLARNGGHADKRLGPKALEAAALLRRLLGV